MAFSSRGHNIFNNQYKMATIIYYWRGVEREGRSDHRVHSQQLAGGMSSLGCLRGRGASLPPPWAPTPRLPGPEAGRPATPWLRPQRHCLPSILKKITWILPHGEQAKLGAITEMPFFPLFVGKLWAPEPVSLFRILPPLSTPPPENIRLTPPHGRALWL